MEVRREEEEGEGGGTWGGKVGKGDESRGGRRAEREGKGEKREGKGESCSEWCGWGRSVGVGKEEEEEGFGGR